MRFAFAAFFVLAGASAQATSHPTLGRDPDLMPASTLLVGPASTPTTDSRSDLDSHRPAGAPRDFSLEGAVAANDARDRLRPPPNPSPEERWATTGVVFIAVCTVLLAVFASRMLRARRS